MATRTRKAVTRKLKASAGPTTYDLSQEIKALQTSINTLRRELWKRLDALARLDAPALQPKDGNEDGDSASLGYDL